MNADNTATRHATQLAPARRETWRATAILLAVSMVIAALAFAAVTAVVFPLVAWAADFAPAGSAGTLTVKVEAAGGGKHMASPGAGLDAREWKLINSGHFTIRLKAMDPMADVSPVNQAKMTAARGAYDKAVTEKDQEIIDKWEEKVNACNGNEGCENQVQAQMMADPRYQRIIMKMQGAAPEMLGAAQAVNVAPRYQAWQSDPMDPSPASGNLQLNLQENGYGVIDSAGGGKVDVSCRWSGSLKIAPGSPESKVGAMVRVDAKTSTFEIRIPAEAFGARLTERCSDNKTGSHGPSKNTREVRLIGNSPAPGVKDFAQALTFKGRLGSVRSPEMRGKQTITTDLFDANNPAASVPLSVTIEWRFVAGSK
jgi:hypothetical protein